jgi:hypothetical protein
MRWHLLRSWSGWLANCIKYCLSRLLPLVQLLLPLLVPSSSLVFPGRILGVLLVGTSNPWVRLVILVHQRLAVLEVFDGFLGVLVHIPSSPLDQVFLLTIDLLSV